jgi:hypothetical protein
MEPHHETDFSAILCRWIDKIVQSSPEAVRLTLAELIAGTVLASDVVRNPGIVSYEADIGGPAV